jgi:hypothetical protein
LSCIIIHAVAGRAEMARCSPPTALTTFLLFCRALLAFHWGGAFLSASNQPGSAVRTPKNHGPSPRGLRAHAVHTRPSQLAPVFCLHKPLNLTGPQQQLFCGEGLSLPASNPPGGAVRAPKKTDPVLGQSSRAPRARGVHAPTPASALAAGVPAGAAHVATVPGTPAVCVEASSTRPTSMRPAAGLAHRCVLCPPHVSTRPLGCCSQHPGSRQGALQPTKEDLCSFKKQLFLLGPTDGCSPK